MDRFPTELLFILFFLGIVVYNYIMRQVARREQEAGAQQAEPPPAEDEPLEDIWGRPRTRLPAPAAAAVPRPAPPATRLEPPAPRRRHALYALPKDKRSLRRAIVIMTVLGPCRAQEQPER